jgi:hypothetical protein
VIRKQQKSIRELFEEGKPIDDALARGVAAALRRHKQLGNPIVVWRDGKIVHIPADQIEVPDIDDPSPQSQR